MDEKITGIQIRKIEVYRPDYFKTIDQVIEEFSVVGKDIEFIAREFLGKEKLHLVKDNQENSLTMGLEVTKKILQSTGLQGTDFDMVVFSSTLPEYVAPPTSLLIHHAIQGKNDAVCYDINANCIGMVAAFNQIYKQMYADKKINRVLLIGADYMTIHAEAYNESTVPNFGDAACAVVIERTEEQSGLIDDTYCIDSRTIENTVLPRCGTSHIYEVDKDQMRMKFEAVPSDLSNVVEMIKNILAKNELEVSDIEMFCFSQSALYFIEYLRDRLNIPEEKSLYTGNQYGYTGTSCPFITLYHAIEEKRVKRGDYIFFWTMGVGAQHTCSIIKY